MHRNDTDTDTALRATAYVSLAVGAAYWYACQWVDLYAACCM
jgi:hypothetical protein